MPAGASPGLVPGFRHHLTQSQRRPRHYGRGDKKNPTSLVAVMPASQSFRPEPAPDLFRGSGITLRSPKGDPGTTAGVTRKTQTSLVAVMPASLSFRPEPAPDLFRGSGIALRSPKGDPGTVAGVTSPRDKKRIQTSYCLPSTAYKKKTRHALRRALNVL